MKTTQRYELFVNDAYELKNMSVGRNRHHKTIKYFVPDNTRGGIVLQISKNSPL